MNQYIGDTIGSGGIFKALRTNPVWLDILRQEVKNVTDASRTNAPANGARSSQRTHLDELVANVHAVDGEEPADHSQMAI
jgi:hypothetical protein